MNVYQPMLCAPGAVRSWVITGALRDLGTAPVLQVCVPGKQCAALAGTDRHPLEATATGWSDKHLAATTGLSLAVALRRYEPTSFSNSFSNKSPKWSAPSGSVILGSSVSWGRQAVLSGLSSTEGDDIWAALEHAPSLSRSPYVSGAFPCFGEYP